MVGFLAVPYAVRLGASPSTFQKGFNVNPTRLAGILFLSAFLAYGVGAAIGSTLLMLLNSAIVIAIGVLLYPTLATQSPRVAIGYLSARLWEGILLGIGAVSFAAGVALNDALYQAAIAGLGIGSVALFGILLRTPMLPRWLSTWGVVGYAIVAIGAISELAGFAGVGIWASIPGGLFEVFFGFWLIVRGFHLAPRNEVKDERNKCRRHEGPVPCCNLSCGRDVDPVCSEPKTSLSI